MVEYSYKTQGTCSKNITLLIDDDVVVSVEFTGGCNGNLQGLSRLIPGMRIPDIIEKLKGINCRDRGTSCPDQLCHALISYCIDYKKESYIKSGNLAAIG